MKKKKGFTLVELLAVIVVLAIILVIAVPKILDVIKSSRENSLISSVKLIARNAEQKLLTNEVLGESTNTLSCDEVADINTTDYKSCTINVNNETKEVTVTIEGKGKFSGYTCSGTKNNVTCGGGNNEELVCTEGYSKVEISGYEMRDDIDIDACKSNPYMMEIDNVFYSGYTYSLKTNLTYEQKNACIEFMMDEGRWEEDIANAICDKNYFEIEYNDNIYYSSHDSIVTRGITRGIDNWFTYNDIIGYFNRIETGSICTKSVAYNYLDFKNYSMILNEYIHDNGTDGIIDYIKPIENCVLSNPNYLSQDWGIISGFKDDIYSGNESITSITFHKSTSGFDGTGIDVSEERNGNIKLYFDEETGRVDIVGNGIISFPEDSSNLFSNLWYLESINFNDSIDTSNVTDMNSMFKWCESLETLDLSSFDTSNVTNISYMFAHCRNLELLDLSNFKILSLYGGVHNKACVETLCIGDVCESIAVCELPPA